MTLPRLSASEVSAAAARLLESPITEAVSLPAGYANETWRVATSTGARYTVKFGPLSSEAKWRSALRALESAAAVGVPVARYVTSARHADRLIRVFEWAEGQTPALSVLASGDSDRDSDNDNDNDSDSDNDSVQRFFTDLGAAVRALHGALEPDVFSSRLDGSAPTFARWPDYIDHRLGAIRARCRATEALDEAELDRACAAIADLAADIGELARPTLCHRDLYPDNLLTDPTGRLVAILDFDMAEAWDCAAEFDKLNRLLFPAFPGAQQWFDAAYLDGRSWPPRWDDRVRLVTMIEALNTLPNAISDGLGLDSDYAASALRRLRALIG